MRNVYCEGDVICAEVQSIHSDGTVALHTRGTAGKYGKLTQGQLVQVPAFLVKKQKQNFLLMKEMGVSVILGYNGYVWVCAASALNKSKQYNNNAMEGIVHDDDDDDDDDEEREQGEGSEGKTSSYSSLDSSTLLYNICIIGNVIRALGDLMMQLTGDTIRGGVNLATTLKVDPCRIRETDFLEKLVDQEAIRRMEEE